MNPNQKENRGSTPNPLSDFTPAPTPTPTTVSEPAHDVSSDSTPSPVPALDSDSLPTSTSTSTQTTAPTPAPTPAPAPTKSTPDPKSSKLPWLCISISVILALASIGFGIYGMAKPSMSTESLKVQVKNSDGTTTVLETNKIESTGNGTTITITDATVGDYNPSERLEIQKLTTEIYHELAQVMRGRNVAESNFSMVYDEGTTIIIPETEVLTRTDEAYGVKSNSSLNNPSGETEKIIMNEAHAYTENYLTRIGFSKVENANTPWDNGFYYNAASKVYCTVTENTLPFSATCAKETWITESERKLAIELSSASKTPYVSVRGSVIENSSVTPYQKVAASVGTAQGLFYRVSPNSEWQFFTSTQAILECSRYSDDAAKAYAGSACWDTTLDRQSTVEP